MAGILQTLGLVGGGGTPPKGAQTLEEAKAVIKRLDLAPYTERAIKEGGLTRSESDEAEKQYRQFMLLVWANQRLESGQMVVPTKLADPIWHQHILHMRDYETFCYDLVGQLVYHSPGLEEGTKPFERAMDHTRDVQRSVGHPDDMFYPLYFGACAAVTSFSSGSGAADGVSGATASSSADHGASCGGASCGGASCGGGGGCGGGCGA